MATTSKKLGNNITVRTYSWRDMVIREWGDEFNRPDDCYKMSGGATFQSTDMMPNGSFYKKPGT